MPSVAINDSNSKNKKYSSGNPRLSKSNVSSNGFSFRCGCRRTRCRRCGWTYSRDSPWRSRRSRRASRTAPWPDFPSRWATSSSFPVLLLPPLVLFVDMVALQECLVRGARCHCFFWRHRSASLSEWSEESRLINRGEPIANRERWKIIEAAVRRMWSLRRIGRYRK